MKVKFYLSLLLCLTMFSQLVEWENTVNDELRKMLKKAVVAILRHCTVIYLEKLKENHKNIIAAQ